MSLDKGQPCTEAQSSGSSPLSALRTVGREAPSRHSGCIVSPWRHGGSGAATVDSASPWPHRSAVRPDASLRWGPTEPRG